MWQQLATELGREPTAGDVADRIGRTPEDVVEALAVGDAHSPASLDAPLHDGDETFTRLDAVQDRRREIALTVDRTALEQLGTALTDREWEVLQLRFQEDLLQREIAERVGVSQMQISRILRASVSRLRTAADDADVLFER